MPAVGIVTDDLVDLVVDGAGVHEVALEADADEHVGVDAECTGERTELVGGELLRASLDGLQFAPSHARGLGDVTRLQTGQLADGGHGRPGPRPSVRGESWSAARVVYRALAPGLTRRDEGHDFGLGSGRSAAGDVRRAHQREPCSRRPT